MPVTPDDLAALEERLLAKLQQPSRVEEIDLPAAVYSRVMYLTAALLVYVCASMLVSSFTTGVVGNLSQIEYLVFPLCFTALFGLVFGALDSDAAGRRAIKLMRAWWIPQIFIVPYMYWTSDMHEDAVLLFVGFAINSIYWPWLLNAVRELLRHRYQGSRTAWAQHYTSRALRLGAFQIVLAVSAVAQGLRGKVASPGCMRPLFQPEPGTVLIYVTAIFDACAVDTRAAATLRLSPLQAAALVSCGVVVLSGLAGYVISEQRRPSKQAARTAFLSMVFSNQFCFIFVGRLVWVARRRARSDDSASVQPVKESEGLEAGAFDLAGA